VYRLDRDHASALCHAQNVANLNAEAPFKIGSNFIRQGGTSGEQGAYAGQVCIARGDAEQTGHDGWHRSKQRDVVLFNKRPVALNKSLVAHAQ